MSELKDLLENNRNWAARVTANDPEFFARLTRGQKPKHLWIGCSDSRVPANEIVDLPPGEVFVHRNVANIVLQTDMNCLSVLQYAVETLKVEHIIVCGHYGCGGVEASMKPGNLALIDNWLRKVSAVAEKYHDILDPIEEKGEKVNRLCELNVIEQVSNVCRTTIIQGAWDQGQKLSVHGWIYDIHDGLLHDLGVSVDGST
ncbi:MAG: carbonate dehydratase [Ignavibacteriae bacterium]|nr:carbonate dehydratase [Ignavibacteriota bacterium]MCB9214950.1 carbonate dehydratase [Ignavibacteria bacterium]